MDILDNVNSDRILGDDTIPQLKERISAWVNQSNGHIKIPQLHDILQAILSKAGAGGGGTLSLLPGSNPALQLNVGTQQIGFDASIAGSFNPAGTSLSPAAVSILAAINELAANRPQRYDAGNGALVYATGSGITFTKAAGIGTFVVPAGVLMLSARINGVTADLAPDMSFTVVFPATVADDFAIVQKINRITGAAASVTFPYVTDVDNVPQQRWTSSNAGDMRSTVIDLNFFSNWALKFVF